jgi:quinol monooxygenase YgiN
MDILKQTMQHARDKEPGATKFALNIPQDEKDDKSIYAVEELAIDPAPFHAIAADNYRYENQAAFDSHLATPVVAKVLEQLQSQSLIVGTPELSILHPFCGFSRPESNTAKNVHIVIGTVVYKEGMVPHSLPYWKGVFDTTEADEPGCMVYSICKPEGKPDVLQTVEMYESSDYLWNVHVKSAAVQESVKHTKDMRVSLAHLLLTCVDGFWHK